MKKLYEITTEIIKAVEEVDSEELMKASLDSLQVEFESKVDQICRVIRNAESEAEMVDAEVKRLQARKRAAERASEWLRNYLKTNMDAAGIPRVKTNLFGVSLSDSKPKVDILSITELSSEFVKTEIIRTPLKEEIIEHFKRTGEVPDGCQITVGKTLRIS